MQAPDQLAGGAGGVLVGQLQGVAGTPERAGGGGAVAAQAAQGQHGQVPGAPPAHGLDHTGGTVQGSGVHAQHVRAGAGHHTAPGVVAQHLPGLVRPPGLGLPAVGTVQLHRELGVGPDRAHQQHGSGQLVHGQLVGTVGPLGPAEGLADLVRVRGHLGPAVLERSGTVRSGAGALPGHGNTLPRLQTQVRAGDRAAHHLGERGVGEQPLGTLQPGQPDQVGVRLGGAGHLA